MSKWLAKNDLTNVNEFLSRLPDPVVLKGSNRPIAKAVFAQVVEDLYSIFNDTQYARYALVHAAHHPQTPLPFHPQTILQLMWRKDFKRHVLEVDLDGKATMEEESRIIIQALARLDGERIRLSHPQEIIAM